MITTHIVHPVTAPDTLVVADITEKVCKAYCFLGQSQPSATVTFQAGAPTVADGIAIFPMTAIVTIVSPTSSKCGCAHSQVFYERFKLALTATGTNTLTIVEGATTTVTPACTKCCKACGVNITKSFTATIA